MIMKLLYMILPVAGLCGCGSSPATAASQPENATNTPPKALVVYYSWGGNTRTVARQIAEITGADIFELQPATPYTRDRDQIEHIAEREVRAGYQPPLAAMPADLEPYDVIYVGSPCWFATIAPPVATFMATAQLSGKKIVPFITHEGSRMGRSVEDLKKLSPKALVTPGLPIVGSRAGQSQAQITDWLRKNNLIE